MSANLTKWTKLLKDLGSMGDYEVKIGVQGEQAAAKHGEGSDLTNAEIAAVHEFSGPGDKPPGRPFIRPPMLENEALWKGKLANMLRSIIIKGENPQKAYRVVGEEYRKAIMDRMGKGIPPPLSEQTINRRKGQNTQGKRDKIEAKGKSLDVTPLIDTGTLRGSISVVVGKRNA